MAYKTGTTNKVISSIAIPPNAGIAIGIITSAPLPVEGIAALTLLIWGDSDPISPVAVGEELLSRIPNARLEIIAGGDHNLAVQHPGPVSDLIHEHLS